MGDDPVRVTAELIEAGRSARGGWSKLQLALLRVPWPPPSGWKTTVIGQVLGRVEADRFVALRDGVRRPEQPSLFDTLESQDA